MVKVDLHTVMSQHTRVSGALLDFRERLLLAMLAAWGLSNLAALPFYRWIEAPAGRLRLGWARTQEA